jgi:hypothetical protein
MQVVLSPCARCLDDVVCVQQKNCLRSFSSSDCFGAAIVMGGPTSDYPPQRSQFSFEEHRDQDSTLSDDSEDNLKMVPELVQSQYARVKQ